MIWGFGEGEVGYLERVSDEGEYELLNIVEEYEDYC